MSNSKNKGEIFAYLRQYCIYTEEIGLTCGPPTAEIHLARVGTAESRSFGCEVAEKLGTVADTEFTCPQVVAYFGLDRRREREEGGTRPGPVHRKQSEWDARKNGQVPGRHEVRKGRGGNFPWLRGTARR